MSVNINEGKPWLHNVCKKMKKSHCFMNKELKQASGVK